MTEPRTIGRPHPGWTMAGAFAVFLSLFVLLAWQVRAGADPALVAQISTPTVTRPVIVHRVVRQVIQDKVIVMDRGRGTSRSGSAPAAQARATASVPRVVASAPAATPAPAPVAPIVTRTS